MYFSRLRIDPFALTAPNNAYAAHQLMWRAFPSKPGTERDFVFRQEIATGLGSVGAFGRHTPVFYVVSKRPPKVDEQLGSVEIKPYDPQIAGGQRFAISLRANPVVSKRDEHGAIKRQDQQGKLRRHDVLMEAKRQAKCENVDPAEWGEAQRRAVLQWFIKQADQFGCSVNEDESFAINGYRQHVLPRKREPPIKFSSVDITGIINVNEPDQLKTALFRGVGKSRGFGCGLLLIRLL